ncbi:hypothetical protein [Allosaccharopolyspora coralli]|nr:hypothetical protein [Allosaccharopolyspora coralli]
MSNANVSNLTRVETITVWAGSAVWTSGIVAAGVVVVVWLGAGPTRLLGAILAVVAIAGFLSVAAVIGRSVLRQEGVERTVYVESSGLAFWLLMGVAFTYMLIQAIADLPQPDGYMIVGAGAVCWALAHGARSEKYL